MSTTREQQARAILAHPRNYYAAQDGIELAETMLELWDIFASEYPEIVEATQYFTAPVRPNCMALRYVEEIHDGENTYLYLDVKTSKECRMCRFILEGGPVEDGGSWVWDGCEFMPEISPELEKAFYYADPILEKVRKTKQTCFVSA